MSAALPTPTKRTTTGSGFQRLYFEYKRDTNAVATWLAASTKFCIPKPKKRLKGQARKLANQQALITTLKRAISLRKKATQVLRDYAVERNAADAESDTRHEHFVSILEEALGILEEAVAKAESTGKGKGKGKAPMTPSSSQFSALDVEEPSQAFSDSPDVILPPPIPSDKNTYEAEIPISWEEICVLFLEMQSELVELQEQLSDTCRQYDARHICLVAMALTGRAINDLGAEVIQRYLPSFEEFGGPLAVAKRYLETKAAAEHPRRFEEISGLKGKSPKSYILQLMLLDPEFNYKMGMHTTHHAHNRLFASMQEQNAWRVGDDETEWMRVFSEELQYLEDVVDLQRPLFLAGRHIMDEDVFRGISRDLAGMGANPQPQDYSLSFILWSLLTIKRTFGQENLATAFKRDMEAQIPSLRNELGYLEWFFSKINPGDGKPSPLAGIQNMVEGLEQDSRGGSWSPSPMPQGSFSLLKSSPSYCGLVLYRVRRNMHLCCLQINHLGSHLVTMAHLNNALEQYGLMKHQWKDMARCSEVIGFDAMFIGGKPTNKSSMTDRLSLALGISVQALAALKKGRQIKQWRSVNGPRLATDNFVILKFFKDNDGDAAKFPMNKRNALAAIAASNLEEVDTVYKGKTAIALVPVDAAKQKKGKAKARAVDREYGESSTSARGETPIRRIIRSLALRIEPEAVALNFPINQFCRSLHTAFDLISAEEGMEVDPLLAEYMDYQTAPATISLTTIFGGIGGKPNEVLLRRAASALNKWLAEGNGEAASNGEDELNRRRVMSKGESSSSKPEAEDVDALAFWRLRLEESEST